MTLRKIASQTLRSVRTSTIAVALLQLCLGTPFSELANAQDDNSAHTRSPIKHVIVIIGENRTFDHVFATYKPKAGETVSNLLSKEIIDEDGNPGPNYWLATQLNAEDTHADKYDTSPQMKSLYPNLLAPLSGGPTDVCKDNGICTLAQARASENGLAPGYYKYLLTGGTGLASHTPDTRIQGVLSTAPYSDLPAGPFQLTNSDTFPYDAYAASPVHRFYQMWQQLDCNRGYGTEWNPEGCRADLFSYVETTVGAGTNGLKQAANFSTDYSRRRQLRAKGQLPWASITYCRAMLPT